MKLCMMSYTMARRPDLFSVRGMLELTKELGLEGIDFVTLHDTPAAELRKMAEDDGIIIAAHTFFVDLNFPTAAERQPGVDALKRGIDDAVSLGAPVIMVPTPGKGEYSREQSRRQIIAGFQEAVDFAKKAGVVMLSLIHI